MRKIICDKCGEEIRAFSNKPDPKKNTGIVVNGQDICAKCLVSAFPKK